MKTSTPELKNVFQAAADMQRAPLVIRAAVIALVIRPAGRHCGLSLYRPEDLARVEEHLAKQSAERTPGA